MQITHDLRVGGLQQLVLNLCRTIDRRRFEVSVLCLRARGELASKIEEIGIEVLLLPQRQNRTDYLSFLKIRQVLKSRKIDIIHTHNTQPLVEGTIAALLGTGVKRIVHTDHGRIFPDKRRYMLAERICSHFVHKIVGVSEQTSADLTAYERIPRHKIVTVPNGIDESLFEHRVHPAAKRASMGLPQSVPLIGTAARLVKGKGIEYLIRALPHVIERIPGTLLLIAGDGPEAPGLRQLVNAAGLAKNVKFLGTRPDIPEILSILDVFVLPSIYEGLPMCILEAMACGCPIVASSVGGIPTALTDGENAYLVPPMQSESLSYAILRLLSDRSTAMEFSHKSQRLFNERFTAKAMTQQYQRLYASGLPPCS